MRRFPIRPSVLLPLCAALLPAGLGWSAVFHVEHGRIGRDTAPEGAPAS